MAEIIILEDDEDLGPLMKQSLAKAGHKVRLYVKGSDAVEGFEILPADIVIADIIIREDGKPVADGGLAVIMKLKYKAREKNHRVKFIAISGKYVNRGMEGILQSAQSLGADTILKKPFLPEELLFKIEMLLDHARPVRHFS